MRKASGVKTPYNDGRYGRRVTQQAAVDAAAAPLDPTGMTRVRLPATAAQGAGKMAPRGARLRRKVQVVGVASEQTKYKLPVRTVLDSPDVHPFDRPKKKRG